jgi:hypothetical protein
VVCAARILRLPHPWVPRVRRYLALGSGGIPNPLGPSASGRQDPKHFGTRSMTERLTNNGGGGWCSQCIDWNSGYGPKGCGGPMSPGMKARSSRDWKHHASTMLTSRGTICYLQSVSADVESLN